MIDVTIQSINSTFIEEAINSPALLADMAAMEKYMSESYSGRIIVELLQNADDAHSSRVYITEKDGNVIFANNGRPFNDADVMAISRSGASDKKRGETIGYRGIGFKSTSFLSSEIIIYSNETAFSFSKAKTAEALGVNEEHVPTIRIPFFVDAAPYKNIIDELQENGFTTIFIFKSSNKDVLREEIESLSSDLMLFLKNIKEIETTGMGEDKLLRVNRRGKEWGQEITIDKKKWGLIDDCIAIKIEDDVFVGCESEDAVYYTFLPTYDKTPYPFKLNGDFSTDPSRKHIRQDETTQAALEALAVSIANVVEKAFANPSPIYKNLLSMINDSVSFSSINMSLRKLLKEQLESRQLLLFNDGTKGKLSEYQCFPVGFEESIVGILRKESDVIKAKSLAPEVYDKLLSKNDVDVSGILMKGEDDEVVPLSESNMTSEDINELLQTNDNNSSLSNVSLKSFTQELGLEYKETGSFRSFSNQADNEEENVVEETSPVFASKPVFKASKPIIPKWRSAENACVEIERFLGNEAKDVSTQNLGYDVESTMPDGRKRYIEVKSVSRSDSSFSLTNNEYTAAHQYGNDYYVCLLKHGDEKSKAIYIQNPLEKLKLEKRIRQWEWYCEEYQGDEIEIEY